MRQPITLAAVLLCAAAAGAQVVTTQPQLVVTQLTSGLTPTFFPVSAAADAWGNLYVLDAPPVGSGSGWSVHRVRPDGTVDHGFAAGTGGAGELAFNPRDGRVFVNESPGLLGAGTTDILAIDPVSGGILTHTVNVAARGFAIDDAGGVYLGVPQDPNQPGGGLYFVPDLQTATPVLVNPGGTTNAELEALSSGDVLVVAGNGIARWNSQVGMGTLLTWLPPTPFFPNQISRVAGVARNPFNAQGLGAVFGFSDLVTVSGGLARAEFRDPQGQGSQVLATLSHSIFQPGLGRVAAGQRRDLYWIDTGAAPGQSFTVVRISEQPTPGVSGSLVVTSAAGLLQVSVYGPPGAVYNLGVMTAAAAAGQTGLVLPGLGVLDLDPFSPDYLPVVDALGLFGPPGPVPIAASGVSTLPFAFAPLPAPVPVVAQHVTFSGAAPNGAFQIGAPVSFLLQ